VCDLETSRMGAPYIYDISRLRVKPRRRKGLRRTSKLYRTRDENLSVSVSNL